MGRCFISLAALFGATSVALGAWGSHGLKSRFTPELLEVFRTAVHYQQIHALALLGVGILALYRPSLWINASGVLFTLGILGFSGTLYLRTLWDLNLGFATPLGGMIFMLAWLILGVTAWRIR
ncbi:uncharacterized membrane protein YgdD (TMEM256/DUF423 family) [Azomonas agilis]|uniref:Uncharacterized membrane protein YgdD (TMEM256/DUF423 family) n=1 Tax=Azomonas agilis TaxID=116849 RepID=A0A562IYZ1_9GAMM|nr:DUF423 domain-containing protein [Azomonas agilis]TWH76102.1 uncharacterized membrane protein YgdD (TMEM256/DUF423 family) [Azomonas agilis]